MELRKIDPKKTVFELCRENPDVAEILAEIGFKDIRTPGMLNTAGRIMTIPKAARIKGIDYHAIRQVFRMHGYEIE